MVRRSAIITGAMVFFGALVCPGIVFADNDSVVDDVNIVVPTACTLAGTLNTAHNATINPGTYQADIGTTTLKALCNDNNGFAIYATGYTGNTIGETNSNKLVGQNTNELIPTGIGTSGNSQWAMKLTTDSGATYPITIGSAPNTSGGADASFSSYHVVPNEYTKVAYRTEGTDVGNNATGSILTTTYAVNIASTQSADTYSGKVIYTLVHPATASAPVESDQIGVTYNGNSLTFTGGATTNRVIYGTTCTPMYIATTPEVAETSNLTNGVQSGGYADSEYILSTKTYNGAIQVKVEVDYGITGNTAGMIAIDGVWDGNPENLDGNWTDYDPIYSNDNISGTKTYMIEGDTVTVFAESWDVPESGYNYGFYIKIYPIYATELSGTEEFPVCEISSTPVSGTYATTTTWRGKWYTTVGGETTFFASESAVIDYLQQNSENLLGTSIELYAYNPYAIVYNGNGATAGTMSGFYTALETNTASSTADLMAYNFKKTGYGFAGWSADPNATVNSNSKIYGPNEKIAGNELTFDNNREATLYAVWVPSAGNMQDFSCYSLSRGQITALTDTRDSNVYAVGRMQDGNCWMMENLRLDAVNSSDDTKAQGFGGAFSGLANSEDTNWNNTVANNKYSTSNITGNFQEFRFPRYNNNNTNIGGTNSTGTTLIVSPGVWDGAHSDNSSYDGNSGDHVQWYGYGNYYTWAAAMANTGNFSSINASEAVSTSICPSGWSLPYGSSVANGSFPYLDVRLGGDGSNWREDNPGEEIVSNRWRGYPNNFVYSGLWGWPFSSSRGFDGRYWSRTANDDYYAFALVFDAFMISPRADGSNKYNGHSVRCMIIIPSES